MKPKLEDPQDVVLGFAIVTMMIIIVVVVVGYIAGWQYTGVAVVALISLCLMVDK